MKRFLKIVVPIILSICIILGLGWYLFSYDKGLTQDLLLSLGHYFADADETKTAAWFYDQAYAQNYETDRVAIEIADKYISIGNYTKAEAALSKTIQNGAGAEVYIALCKAYIAQDKLYDAVELLDGIQDITVRQEIEALRPAAPTTTIEEKSYNELLSIPFEANQNKLYVNPYGEYPSVLSHAYQSPITLVEGENLLYAIAVSDSGLVSPLRIFKFTVHGVIEAVNFKDPAIEAEIRKLLYIHNDRTVYSNELWDIKEFTIPSDAKTYDDLKHMLYLEELTIVNGVAGQLHKIQNTSESFCDSLKTLAVENVPLTAEDLNFISTLTNLEILKLENCAVATSAPLTSLSKLRYLNLNNNAVRNIDALKNMAQLQHLHMQSNALVDLTPISGCTQLEILDVSYNAIADITPLASLAMLKEMNISHNQISDLGSIAQMMDLTKLIASNNIIADIAPLGKCTKLAYLNISNNQLTSLDAILSSNNMTYLNFSHNQVAQLPQWDDNSAFVTIDGSYNLLTDLTPLGNLKNINNILMDYNENISSVEALAQCPVLIQVNVYGTKVTDVHMLTEQSIIVNYNPVTE